MIIARADSQSQAGLQRANDRGAQSPGARRDAARASGPRIPVSA